MKTVIRCTASYPNQGSTLVAYVAIFVYNWMT